MFLTSPIWLWALTGLLIPLSIHLLSRKEGKVIYLGSLRYLDESTTRQFRAIRLNELLLLIVRCLLIIITVLLLAGLKLRTSPGGQRKWVVAEPGMNPTATTAGLLDSLGKSGFELHYLTSSFPTTPDSLTRQGNYWTLIDDLSRTSLDSVIILSHARLANFAGEQVTLPANTLWLTVPATEKEYSLFQKQITNDSVIVRQVRANENETTARYQRRLRSATSDSTLSLPADTIHVTIAHDDMFAYDATILEASLKALQDIPACVIAIKKTSLETVASLKSDWVIVLSSQPVRLPDTNQIIFEENSATSSIMRCMKRGEKQQWHLTRRLDAGVALQQNLTVKLGHILTDQSAVSETYAKHDLRSLPDFFLKTSSEHRPITLPAVNSVSLSVYLLVLLMLMVLAERLLAYQRNQ